MKVLYSNVDCLTNKMNDIKLLIFENQKNKPDIILLTEINAKNFKYSFTENELKLPGYKLYSKNIGIKNRRGIVVYVNDTINVIECTNIDTKFEEQILLEIINKQTKNIYISCIYRSPNSEVLNDNLLYEYIKLITNKNNNDVLIVGDFNLPHINWNCFNANEYIPQKNSINYRFLKCLNNNFLNQHVINATRIRGMQNQNILDLIITNGNFIKDIEYQDPIGNSDHVVLTFKCMLEIDKNQETLKTKYNFNKGDYNKLREYITQNINEIIKDENDDINSFWNKFKNLVLEGMEQCIPKIKINGNENKSMWKRYISKELKSTINKKHRLWTRYMETGNQIILNKYKEITNKIRNETRKLLKQEQKSIAESSRTNPKKFWNYVNKFCRNENKMDHLIIDKDNKEYIVTSDKEKCSLFVNYFSSVFIKEPELIEEDILFKAKNCKMNNITINDDMIIKKLNKLKIDKSPGVDGLHPRVLKEIRHEITPLLNKLFNLSLTLCKLPDDWKLSNVSVLYKKGPKRR